MRIRLVSLAKTEPEHRGGGVLFLQLVSMSRYCWHADVSPLEFLTHCENMSFSFAHEPPATTAACQREGVASKVSMATFRPGARPTKLVPSLRCTGAVSGSAEVTRGSVSGRGVLSTPGVDTGHGFSATSGHGFRYKSSKPFNLYPARSTAAPARACGSRWRTSGLRPTHFAPP